MEPGKVLHPIGPVSPDACRFALHPIVPISSQAMQAWDLAWNEALLRPGQWHGSMSPADLIEALYSDTPLETDVAIFRRITARLVEQRERQRVSINIHPDSLTRSPFMSAALEALRAVRAKRHSICLELVEFGYCSDRKGMIENANILRRHGALIALDDFGSRLNFFDLCAAGVVDVIKIDVSVTAGVDHCSNRQSIVRSIQTLSDGLGAHVVAEGIENHRELSALIDMGVSYGQGFLFKQPAIEEGV